MSTIVCILAMAAADPAVLLDRAHEARRAGRYEEAVALFRSAIAAAPERPAPRKDLAYTLLKIGETEAARDEFREAARLDPGDHHTALEYAFLAFETKQRAEARRVFERVRREGDAESRATAERAFAGIDRDLAEGIDRWRKALEADPGNFSAHHELARLAEERDEHALAVNHYEAAWRLRPRMRSLLVDLGRVWKLMGNLEQANAALLAASRGAEPHAAERARALMDARYPYVYEFRNALALDPENIELRRELAYLHLKMGNAAEAEAEFAWLVERAADDLLSAAQLGFLRLARDDTAGAMPLLQRVLEGGDEALADRVRTALGLPQTLRRPPETPRRTVAVEARTLAERSLEAGYMKDALHYLRIAHETDPVDFGVMLKLGWANNIIKDDAEALRWFEMAGRSPDERIASEAQKARANLRPAEARAVFSAWMLPFFSTRWHDAFGYGQIKTEFRPKGFPLRPYLSVRFIGDVRSSGGALPQYLSESSYIFGAGLATPVWHGLTGWFEAGSAVRYLKRHGERGGGVPDYRGGLSLSRGWGGRIGAARRGAFFETSNDAVYLSRFDDDVLLYSHNRFGFTLPAGWFRSQIYWNVNANLDWKREYWANFGEAGPGIRFRFSPLPASMYLFADAVRGAYFINRGNPRRPNFIDVRAGFWYSLSHHE